MPLRIIRNDITKVAADAIVNTANPRPCIGAGTDLAIHEAAGPALLEARREIGDIAPGTSVATPAFSLPAKYVFHTVSPVWRDGTQNEEALLRKAYGAALHLAETLGCTSVAFPLMAAGSYDFPRDLALSIAISAFTDFLMDHELTVYLVLFNGKAFSLASSLFADLRSYIDDNYVEELISDQTAKKIDDGTTDYDIYAWLDNGTVYWWSEAQDVALNSDASGLFMAFVSLARGFVLRLWEEIAYTP